MSRRAGVSHREDWFADADVDKAQIFVPAIMGAGILISLLTLVRDALHRKKWRGQARRVSLQAHAAAHHALTGEPPGVALAAGVRPRVAYLLVCLSSGTLAVYVCIGATLNYLRTGYYVVDILWLWALSLVATAAFGAVAVVCGVAFVRWPRLPRWQLPLLAHTPLGQRPASADAVGDRPPLLLGWAAAATTAAAAIFTFVVAAAPHRVAGVDAWMAQTTQRWSFAGTLDRLDLFGLNPTYLLLVAVIGLATLRCRSLAPAYLACVVVGLSLELWLNLLVPRDRPASGPLAGSTDSFPSGHELQAVLIAMFVPLALQVLRRSPWLAVIAGTLGLLVVAAAVGTMHAGLRWWSDIVAGALWGAALAVVALWVLGYRSLHRQCAGCPWSVRRRPAGEATVRLPDRLARLIRAASRTWVPAAVAGFAVIALTVGLPASPDGDSLGMLVSGAAQLVLLVLAAAGWVVAWKWEGAGAVLLAVAGSMLGLLAALAYDPLVSVAVTAAFLAPAFGFWLVWQHRNTARAVALLGLVTMLVLGGTWAATAVAYDRFFGPAHPPSALPMPPVDRVVWAWTGGVTDRRATVAAELVAGSRQGRLWLEPVAGGPARASATITPGTDNVVRMEVGDLDAATAYRYRIEVDGVPDGSRGRGSFRTMPSSAASFAIAFGACAYTGSSGAVFDAIAAMKPALYVALGDLHYGNPSKNDVAVFGNLYRRVLTAPAQAELYRNVPVAYVWDDHDYGTNDADSTVPTRPAARAAYQRYVPHYPLQSEAINQAFSIGRVRIVLTDTRSERTAASMLGEHQLAWLERELVTASRSHALVIWVNPNPWIVPANPGPGSDDWGAYPDERRRLADTISAARIDNLVMVGGDAHMVAIDDGTNTGFGTAPRRGFPLLHAGALDRPGSVKGGPYSHGTYPGPGQFGTITITDNGGPVVDAELTGRNWRGDILTSYLFRVATSSP